MEVSTKSAVRSPTFISIPRRTAKATRKSSQSWKAALLFLLIAGFFFILFIFMLFGTVLIGLFSEPPAQIDAGQWEVATGFPQAAQKYLPIYQEAGRKYGVPWPILAAIHKIETDFGRNLSVSSVGARGHMQFMDKTWLGWSFSGGTRLGDLPDHVNITDPDRIEEYGGYGVDADGDGRADPYNPVDAIHATAKYLAANHKPGDDWFKRGGAVWQYNHDYENYVLKVKQYAEAFARPVLSAAGSAAGSGQFLWPVPGGKVTSSFGYRFHPLKKVYRMHEGIDIGKELGAPILASDSGVVIESRKAEGYGWMIVIDHGNGYQTLYAHMEEKDVQVHAGQKVKKGQMIARVGSNGWSTGPHLHFEIRRNGQIINPEQVVKVHETLRK
ncbi:peptidoglycan DD-metalloendopeptidase family protein [Lihuaxuella thermophila]|uniref:Murein DD-endopeptidase MepM and murein hydrolase activator NlpD, contain LysM domain n=1 Tax=Lihuaxuella thermophila TaxID=1173111 RepID=A0A1H8HHG1_9BACL|nr:peptidoglycan DD-metalloendopeptidase family protein [Lihuaxuella thermophila]SEN55377.1 Murein DD-endopeptidase MepM and murein hydrolase activator NlpD, contain LysM domain [Lihuaxuella thermophila]